MHFIKVVSVSSRIIILNVVQIKWIQPLIDGTANVELINGQSLVINEESRKKLFEYLELETIV